VRRTAVAAREEILDAAERRLLEVGPGGIRLQEIAADVGVSHPAILHHFGSREGLVKAVVDRALVALQEDLVGAFQSAGGPPDGAALLDRVFETLADRGHGRLLAWLTLSGFDDSLDMTAVHANWKTINDAMHALRISSLEEEARGRGHVLTTKPDYEDTVFTVMLSALALFAQSIAGPAMFRMAGIDGDRATTSRFRKWLAGVLIDHMSKPSA
jgi:AcrR family transcriptional regulator